MDTKYIWNKTGPGLDVRNKEMRRVKDDCASGFSNFVDGWCQVLGKGRLGEDQVCYKKRDGSGGKKGCVKFEMLRNHPSGFVRNTNLEVRPKNTNSGWYIKLWNLISHLGRQGRGGGPDQVKESWLAKEANERLKKE